MCSRSCKAEYLVTLAHICHICGKVSNLSKPQFPHLENGDCVQRSPWGMSRCMESAESRAQITEACTTMKTKNEAGRSECQSLSRVQLFATLWIAACQAPLSMEFSRQEYWSGLPCPPPGDLPNLGINPGFAALPAYPLPSESPRKP